MGAFWLSLAAIFIAELGDKTQLVALSLSSRFNAKVVLAGILVATLLVHVISVALGGCAGCHLPANWIAFIAGLAFIGFGFWTVKGDSLDEDGECKCRGNCAFWIVSSTFFLAELGDKTMLSTVTLAAEHSLLPVWLGSSLGMVASDGLAIIVGQVLGSRLPERPIKIGASCIFFGFGIYKLLQGAIHLPQWSWALAAVITLGLAYFTLGRGSNGTTCRVSDIAGSDEEPEAIGTTRD